MVRDRCTKKDDKRVYRVLNSDIEYYSVGEEEIISRMRNLYIDQLEIPDDPDHNAGLQSAFPVTDVRKPTKSPRLRFKFELQPNYHPSVFSEQNDSLKSSL